jgi:hypothetical protein
MALPLTLITRASSSAWSRGVTWMSSPIAFRAGVMRMVVPSASTRATGRPNGLSSTTAMMIREGSIGRPVRATNPATAASASSADSGLGVVSTAWMSLSAAVSP